VVTGISAEPDASGATVVRITANGEFTPDGYLHFHMTGPPPREVVRLRGIQMRYRPYTTPVDDANVVQIRAGHHPEYQPPELHVVCDLASDEVTITGFEIRGQELLVFLAAPADAGTVPTPEAPPPPTPTPSPPPTPRPTPLPPTPTPVPTAVPTPETTPEPEPEAPTATATPVPEPEAEVREPVAVELPVVLYQAGEETLPPPPRFRRRPPVASTIREIVASRRPDGSTLIRITGDGEFRPGSFGGGRVSGVPSQRVLVLNGIKIPDAPAVIEVGDANLEHIVVSQHPDGEQLELVLQLTSWQVSVTKLAHQGQHVVLVLTPSPGG
jgi:hypothetical protein